MIRLEEIVDTLLQQNEGNIELDPSWLEHTLQNTNVFSEEVGSILQFVLAEFIETDAASPINFVEMAIKLEKIYQHSNVIPQFLKCPARDIYRLFDMDEKGFVSRNDLSAFIEQLEDAQVENIEEITYCIWGVYEISDFLSTGQIFYTGIYIMYFFVLFQ